MWTPGVVAGFQQGLVLVGQTGPEGLLRMKGWVDGGTDPSRERDGGQVIQTYPSHRLDYTGPDAFRQPTMNKFQDGQ